MQTPVLATLTAIPEHVHADQVFPFDMYFDESLIADIQQGYRDLQLKAPEIFYTPFNGGHWVVTRNDLVQKILKDPINFSSAEIGVPKSANPIRQIPINLDPPEHGPYRHMLMKYFTPNMVSEREDSMRRWAHVVIDRSYAQGCCEFTENVGAAFPVYVFMEMMGLPLERAGEFRSIATEFFSHIPAARRHELSERICAEIDAVVEDRLKQPRNDLISKLLEDEVGGHRPTREELRSIGFLLFVAGLDTVANVMGFMFHFLAQKPDLQELLRCDASKIPPFVEEALRRFPIVAQSRLVMSDLVLAGAHLKAGDMITAPLAVANLDDRIHIDPMAFDIDRQRKDHIAFSVGPHFCMGHHLARSELRMFLAEFLKRIPRFHLPEGFRPQFRAAGVMALENLRIEWDVVP